MLPTWVSIFRLLLQKEDLQDAERKILLEYDEINRARKDLEWQEEEIIVARVKQEKLEEELRLANVDFASQATIIMQLLRDNLTLWTSDLPQDGKQSLFFSTSLCVISA